MESAAAPHITATRIREHIEGGRLLQALADADIALESANATEQPILLCLKSLALVTTGQALAGLRIATQAHELAAALSKPVIEGEALLAVGFALQTLEEHASAIDAFTHAERLAKQSGDNGLCARALRRLGISCSVLGRHQQALEILEQAAASLEQHGTLAERYHARYSVLNAKGRATDTLDANDAARQRQYRALFADWQAFSEEVASLQLTRLELMSLTNAGIAAHRAGDYEVSLAILERGIAGHAHAGQRGHEALAVNHLGEVLLALGRVSEAVETFKRGIALQEGGSPRELMAAWEALAGAYETIDDPRLALASFKQARSIERTLHDDDARLAAARREQREEIARLSEQWTRLAEEDPLTGVANRRAFDRSLEVMLDGARAGRHFSLLWLDLDLFKHINDTFGHAAGDVVLQRFASVLRLGRRAGDLAARVGGEEFALILPLNQKHEAVEIAERICQSLKSTEWLEISAALRVTVSIGIALSHEVEIGELSAKSIYQLADRRLYRAKAEGRDRVNASA